MHCRGITSATPSRNLFPGKETLPAACVWVRWNMDQVEMVLWNKIHKSWQSYTRIRTGRLVANSEYTTFELGMCGMD